MRKLIVLAAIVATGCSHEDANRFDLACSGSRYTISDKTGATGTTKPMSWHYRFDLKAKRYCQGDCLETFALHNVSDTEISESDEADGLQAHLKINRESGSLDGYMNYAGAIDSDTATCQRKPFSGFPTKKF